jgi:hypothetical protein
MSLALQIFLIIISVLSLILCIKNVARAKMSIGTSILWLTGSILLIIISIFPRPIMELARLFGFLSASNFVFLCIIVFLLIKNFHNDKKISELDNKLKNLDHSISLEDYATRKQSHQKGKK